MVKKLPRGYGDAGFGSGQLAHKLRDPKFYTARTKRTVNSGGAL